MFWGLEIFVMTFLVAIHHCPNFKLFTLIFTLIILSLGHICPIDIGKEAYFSNLEVIERQRSKSLNNPIIANRMKATPWSRALKPTVEEIFDLCFKVKYQWRLKLWSSHQLLQTLKRAFLDEYFCKRPFQSNSWSDLIRKSTYLFIYLSFEYSHCDYIKILSGHSISSNSQLKFGASWLRRKIKSRYHESKIRREKDKENTLR